MGSVERPWFEALLYGFRRNFFRNNDRVADALVDVYGDRILDSMRDIQKERSHVSAAEIVGIVEAGNTYTMTSLFRHRNLQALASALKTRQGKDHEILCVGCGNNGLEPYGLAMYLAKSSVGFRIDGVDINKAYVESAMTGRISKSEANDISDHMQSEDYVVYEEGVPHISNKLLSRMKFFQHDIINGPASQDKEYDGAVCNNLLQHFPKHTRELILIHILQNLKDGAFLALEPTSTALSRDEEAWLKPYNKWKKSLKRFGLTPREVDNVRLLEYKPNRNRFRSGKYAIRNRRIVRH